VAIAVDALPAAAEAVEGGAATAESSGAAASPRSPARRRSPAPRQPEAAPWQAVSAGTGHVRGAASAAWNATPSGASRTVTRLIWAVALGLIALQVLSEATGQFWSFSLPSKGKATKQPYLPLYSGQQNPLVFTGTTAAPNLPLSNRSAGNQGML
jgi:hypothetical protein